MTTIEQHSPSTAEPFFSVLELQHEHVALMRLMRASTTLPHQEQSELIPELSETSTTGWQPNRRTGGPG